MRLNYSHLKYFWCVAHEGHLTRAAKKLFISQSALSVQIKSLEDQLGHALFDRKGKKLILTEAGRIVLDHADLIFKTGDELVNKLNDSDKPEYFVLRVGVIATLSRNFQMQFLDPLIQRSDVELIISSGRLSSLLQRLESHELDVVLTNNIVSHNLSAPWVSHLIASQPVSLVGSPKLAKKNRSLKEMLSEEPLILPSAHSSFRLAFDALMDRLNIQPKIVAEVDDMAMLRLISVKKEGLTLVPPIVVKDELSSKAIVEIKKIPELSEHFYAVTLKRRFPNPLIRELFNKKAT